MAIIEIMTRNNDSDENRVQKMGPRYITCAAYSRPNSGTDSRLFEVNIWMWHCGMAFPRKILVKDAAEMRQARLSESRRRGAATLKRRGFAAAERQQD